MSEVCTDVTPFVHSKIRSGASILLTNGMIDSSQPLVSHQGYKFPGNFAWDFALYKRIGKYSFLKFQTFQEIVTIVTYILEAPKSFVFSALDYSTKMLVDVKHHVSASPLFAFPIITLLKCKSYIHFFDIFL